MCTENKDSILAGKKILIHKNIHSSISSKIQGCQVSWISHETHGYSPLLTVSQQELIFSQILSWISLFFCPVIFWKFLGILKSLKPLEHSSSTKIPNSFALLHLRPQSLLTTQVYFNKKPSSRHSTKGFLIFGNILILKVY